MKPSAQIKITAIDSTHYDRLAELGRSTFLETFQAQNDPEAIKAYVQQAFSVDGIRAEHQTEGSHFYILWVDEQAAGYLKLNSHDAQTEPMGRDGVEVERLYLKSDFHGQGLGEALLDFAIAKAQEMGCQFIWLGVWEKNKKAIGFYEKIGFQITGEHMFMMGSEKQRDFIMRKPLS